ncbi:MAG TPA: hypothetical protein VJ256_04310 [Dehalococcoidia bacterium]|nr:hypothetical protein [Dehalococcoidia bacterium]
MKEHSFDTLSTKIAALLLLHEGEITLTDIEALPLVESQAMAAAIAMRLVEAFSAERSQRKRSKGDISFWEDVIRLRQPGIAPVMA